MYLYNFRGFTTFLELLKNGIIKADLVARISKSGPDKGRYRNKKIVFSIKKENISKLFECYYQFNYDNIY